MARGKSKCVICGMYYPTETMEVISGKKYCKKCAEEPLKEAKYYKELCAYISNIFGGAKNCNMPLITSQIKRLKKENEEMTTRGMLTTLQYIFEILELSDNIDPNFGIVNLLTRYYWEAKQYYIKKVEIKHANKEIMDVIIEEPEPIILKRSDLIKRQEAEDKKKDERENRILLDANTIEDDGITIDINEEFKTNNYYSSYYNNEED